MPREDFANNVLETAGQAGEFIPQAYYDPDGDCIEFIAKPDPFYGERIDDLVTVYYSQDSGEIIGSLIKGVSVFLKKLSKQLPGFRISIEDHGVRLEHIFQARVWVSTEPEKLPIIQYRKLEELAKETHAKADMIGV